MPWRTDLKTPLTAMEIAGRDSSALARAHRRTNRRSLASGQPGDPASAYTGRGSHSSFPHRCETPAPGVAASADRIRDSGARFNRLGNEPPPTPLRSTCSRICRRLRLTANCLIQAVKQLIDNALKYSPARSVITVAAAEVSGSISLSVRDQGQGLTELEQGHVFDKFYRGQQSSSGIQGTGMSACRSQRKSPRPMGGSVHVESQTGNGSRFTITLPAAQPEVPVSPAEVKV